MLVTIVGLYNRRRKRAMSKESGITLFVLYSIVAIYSCCAKECYITGADVGHKLLCIDINERLLYNSTLTNVTEILMLNYGFNTIPDYFFSAFNKSLLQALTMSQGNLSFINNTSFSNFTELNRLNLTYNKIVNITEKAFHKNVKLKTLSLLSNQIKELKVHTFSTLVDLEYIDMSRNHLKQLHKHLLLNNKNLRVLNVKSNSLTELPNVMFHHLQKLTTLDASFNHIEEISPHIFKFNYALASINLQGNKIKTLSHGIVHLNLRELNLLGNRLDFNNQKIIEILRNLKRSQVALKVENFEHKHKKTTHTKETIVYQVSPSLQFILGGIVALLVVILIVLSGLLYHVHIRKKASFKRYYKQKWCSGEYLHENEDSDLHLNISDGNAFYHPKSEEGQHDSHEVLCSCATCFSKKNNSVET